MFMVLSINLVNVDAGLMGVHDPTVVGNGASPTDGFNLTRDTATGLEWLDLTLSTGLSFNDVSASFGTGQAFDGFRYATLDEIQHLLGSVQPQSLKASSTPGDLFHVALMQTVGITEK